MTLGSDTRQTTHSLMTEGQTKDPLNWCFPETVVSSHVWTWVCTPCPNQPKTCDKQRVENTARQQKAATGVPIAPKSFMAEKRGLSGDFIQVIKNISGSPRRMWPLSTCSFTRCLAGENGYTVFEPCIRDVPRSSGNATKRLRCRSGNPYEEA